MSHTILIVDDDLAIRDSISSFLKILSYQVYTTDNPGDALLLMQKRHVDVVITDVYMRHMTGLELTRKIKEDFDIDVIVMTGLDSEYSYEEAVSAGAADFIFKPFRFTELNLRLNRVLRERTLRKERDLVLKELKKMVVTDGLTGLYNSRHFFTQIEKETQRCKRYNHPLSLLIMDIDFFKKYNDTWGHLEGNNVLSVIGRLLQASMRSMDTAYRYGGEEFATILPETNIEEAYALAERIRKTVMRHPFFPKPAQEVFITISIGAAQIQEKESINSFIKRADKALYKAKDSGRNQVIAARV